MPVVVTALALRLSLPVSAVRVPDSESPGRGTYRQSSLSLFPSLYQKIAINHEVPDSTVKLVTERGLDK